MTDYSKMSDFEINKAVGDAIGLEWSELDQNYNGLCYWEVGCLFVFNPIKDPADAWPIIAENRIGIIPAPENGWWKAAHRKVGSDSDPYHMNKDSNPLRAAMIVFLMMQESKNAKIPSERDS
ncbi:phage protein NinX family protein [Klebsiella variicola]|nr:DUF2591 family protein [Klebsiella variicola]